MPKLLYVMQVSWGWIKQRPHFLAEGLSEHYQTTVLFDKNENENVVENPDKNLTNLRIKTFPKLFGLRKGETIARLNYYFKKIYCVWKAYNTDVIWLTSPAQYNHFKHFIPKSKKIVYDNMDDLLEFYPNNASLKRLEKELCSRANHIFCSSQNLMTKIIHRHGSQLEEKINVVNNAIVDKFPTHQEKNTEKFKKYFSSEKKSLVYIGTIAEWFDFDSVEYALNENLNVEMILVGPLQTSIPKHNRIKHIPSVAHEDVFTIMDLADGLIMPFVLNEIVLGVNPVKAYEYIYSGKHVFLVRYPETEIFEDFTYLYDSKSELSKLISEWSLNKLTFKKERAIAIDFAMNNTWNNRSKTIIDLIKPELNK